MEQRIALWLAARPENRAAWHKMQRYYKKLDALQRLATDKPDPNVVNKWVWRRGLHRSVFPLAAAAAIVVAGISFWGWLPQEARYQTAVGQQQQVVLSDHTVVTLNTDSKIVVRYDGDERRVLLEQGEAHFAISSDPDRPFVVIAGAGAVRAIGTAFSVYLNTDADVVEVTVTEGVVEVVPNVAPEVDRKLEPVPNDHNRPMAERLVEGNQIEYRESIESISSLGPNELARELAWQDGVLEFIDEPLDSVILEASRYFDMRITIADAELGRTQVTALFGIGDPELLLNLIESNAGIGVRRVGPGHAEVVKTAF